MSRTCLFVLTSLVLLFGGAGSAEAKRLALVIGNNNYENVADLQKAVNDAEAIGDTLRDLGFEIVRAQNLNRRGCCQINANQSQKCVWRRLSGRQLTPFSECGSAVQLEGIAAVEMAVLVEVIVDRGVSSGKLLQGLDVPEFRHRALSSSKRLV